MENQEIILVRSAHVKAKLCKMLIKFFWNVETGAYVPQATFKLTTWPRLAWNSFIFLPFNEEFHLNNNNKNP